MDGTVDGDTTAVADGGDERPTVLLIDDQPDVVAMYEAFLGDRCTVRSSTDPERAIEQLDAAVDVVLLDRHMPTRNGDDLLVEFREAGYEMPVAMVTAVDPKADIVDLPFDDYLTKPVTRDELRQAVAVLANRQSFDAASRELYRLASKRAALEAESTFDERASDEYARLIERMTELRTEVEGVLDELFEVDHASAFRSF